jgi:transposase InsO family protein
MTGKRKRIQPLDDAEPLRQRRPATEHRHMAETVFKTLKAEFIWRTIFVSRSGAEIAIGHYIDGFYNPVRRHSALG